MENEIKFKLHEKQIEVWKSPARYRVLVAGRRWGKTTMAIVDLLLFAMANPNSYLWLISPTYKQSKMIAWRMLRHLTPRQYQPKFNEVELSVTLVNGSVIELKGAESEDNLRGVGLDGMVIDEFASIRNNWQIWHEVLRPALSDKKGWVLFIGTPKGKDALYELYLKGQRQEDNYQSWQFETLDNPFIAESEVDEAGKTMPERYFRQEYKASFEDYVGVVYPEFNKNHVIEPFFIPSYFVRVGCIDTAMTGTTGVLKVAIDENGTMYVYDEFYEADKRVSEIAQAVKEETDITWYIDPEAHSKKVKRGETLYSLYDEFVEHGIVAINAQKDIDAGINRVGEALKQDRIRIFSTCKNFIHELERYHWATFEETASGEPKPKPYHKDCHLCDCIRYIVMSREGGIDVEKLRVVNPNSAWGRRMAAIRKEGEFIYGR